MKKETKLKQLKPLPSDVPALFTYAEVCAVQALYAGTATPEQQQRALKWIVERAAGALFPSFDADSARRTDFALGRRFVGEQINGILIINASTLRQTQGED